MTEINNNVKCRLEILQINYTKKTTHLFFFLTQKIQKRIMFEKKWFFDKIVLVNVHTIDFLGTAR